MRIFPISNSWWSFNAVPRTLQNILVDLNNVLVWFVWMRPPISTSSSNLGRMFRKHYLQLVSLSLSYSMNFLVLTQDVCAYLSFPCLWFSLSGLTRRQSLLLSWFSFVLFIFLLSLSRNVFVLCKFHLVVWSNSNSLHNSQWNSIPTQSCLMLYSFCTCLQHLSLCD